MAVTTADEGNRGRVERPRFRYNHPKNYLGVAIAAAADGDTGGLVQAYVVRGAGAARDGARQLGLLDADGGLTPAGQHVAEYARSTYGGYRAALERFDEWRGTSNRFVELDEGRWRAVAPDVIADHTVCEDVLHILDENEGKLTLPQLAHAYLHRWPEAARTAFVRGGTDIPDGPAEQADALYRAETYHTAVTCQLKTIMYHAGLLTETGADSSHLVPQTDVWELEPDAMDAVNGGDRA